MTHPPVLGGSSSERCVYCSTIWLVCPHVLHTSSCCTCKRWQTGSATLPARVGRQAEQAGCVDGMVEGTREQRQPVCATGRRGAHDIRHAPLTPAWFTCAHGCSCCFCHPRSERAHASPASPQTQSCVRRGRPFLRWQRACAPGAPPPWPAPRPAPRQAGCRAARGVLCVCVCGGGGGGVRQEWKRLQGSSLPYHGRREGRGGRDGWRGKD